MLVLLMFSPGHEEDNGDEEAEDGGEEGAEGDLQADGTTVDRNHASHGRADLLHH